MALHLFKKIRVSFAFVDSITRTSEFARTNPRRIEYSNTTLHCFHHQSFIRDISALPPPSLFQPSTCKMRGLSTDSTTNHSSVISAHYPPSPHPSPFNPLFATKALNSSFDGTFWTKVNIFGKSWGHVRCIFGVSKLRKVHGLNSPSNNSHTRRPYYR